MLGDAIALGGNHVYHLFYQTLGEGKQVSLLSFPVKKNWWETADIELIKHSCIELVAMADSEQWTKVIIPRPGCGNGKLDWTVVRENIKDLLDDRFLIISY
jgi:hypothetical protein